MFKCKDDYVLNVYLDLEATESGNEIIAFGAVTEFGDEFYSLVKPKHLDKITPFITKLTGLSEEMYLEDTPDIRAVIEDFWNWCKSFGYLQIRLFCYGSYDKKLLQAEAFRNLDVEGFYYVLDNLFNLCDVAAKILNLTNKTPSLKNLYKLFVKKEIIQTHNPVDDAKMLKEIHKYIIDTPIEVFIKYEENYHLNKYVKRFKKGRGRNKNLNKFFKSIPYEELDNLTFEDIRPYLGYSHIERLIREDYLNLTGKNFKGKIG